MNQHELYFSRHCKYSKSILDELQKMGQCPFQLICVDRRFTKNNVTYVTLPDGKHVALPPMINRVPILLLKPKFEILSGNQILDFLRPQVKRQEKTMLYTDPNPFDLSRDTLRSSGVASDHYSFLDMEPQELAPQGNGGLRQMYSYATVEGDVPMNAPMEDKKGKMSYSMEEIEQMRNQEFPELVRKSP